MLAELAGGYRVHAVLGERARGAVPRGAGSGGRCWGDLTRGFLVAVVARKLPGMLGIGPGRRTPSSSGTATAKRWTEPGAGGLRRHPTNELGRTRSPPRGG